MLISVEEAAKRLNGGEVVAIPTETVYGLAAVYNNTAAVQNIFKLKNRPPQNPLIMHVSNSEEVGRFAVFLPETFPLLTASFWPGPLTLVLPANTSTIPAIVRAGLATQGFRMPAHSQALALLEKTGPLVAPSANLSGKPSSVTAEHVEADFGASFPILEGEVCSKGVESTILVWQEDGWKLGRLGAIPPEAFTPILGYIPLLATSLNAPLCPGQLFRHYAPQAKLCLGLDPSFSSLVLGFSERDYSLFKEKLFWARSDQPEEALKNLYPLLRYLDSQKIEKACLDISVPQAGLWLTFLERLSKAAK
jgi:L-threonylcarbamoyladenylate synthase